MKFLLYAIIISLGVCIIHLTALLVERPFNSSCMRDAYYAGCNIGLDNTLTAASTARCTMIADMYKQSLDDMMDP